METRRPRPPGALHEPSREPSGRVPVAGAPAPALSLAQVEAVLRRAVQLETMQRLPDAPGLTAGELTRVALEAGLSPEAVEAALRELELGQLPGDRREALLDRLFGPACATAGRSLTRPSEVLQARLQQLLGDELLEPLERQGRRTIWAPVRGLRAGVLRAVRLGWKGSGDWKSMELTAEVRPADAAASRSLVLLEARLSDRATYSTGPLLAAAATALATLVLGGTGLDQLLQHGADAAPLLVGAGGAAFGGAAVAALMGRATARAWRRRLRRVRASLDQVLDRLERSG